MLKRLIKKILKSCLIRNPKVLFIHHEEYNLELLTRLQLWLRNRLLIISSIRLDKTVNSNKNNNIHIKVIDTFNLLSLTTGIKRGVITKCKTVFKHKMVIKHKFRLNIFKVLAITFRRKDTNTIINQLKGFDTTIIERK